MAEYDVDDTLQNILEPLYSFLSSVLPPPIYSVVESLLTNSLAFLTALFNLVSSLTSSQSWDSQKLLPPIITLLMAYLALVSFYRTTGWMIRTTFWFVKWGGILAALAAGAGYLMGNQANGGNGVGAVFNGGLLSTLGSALLGMLNGDSTLNRSRSRSRAGASGSGPRTRTQARKQKEKERPKAWENWDKHRDWQYSADAAGRDDAARMSEGVQEAVQKVAGLVQQAMGTGWWETVKNAVEGSGLVGTSGGDRREDTRSEKKSKQDAKGRGSSR